jgi:threonine synthase
MPSHITCVCHACGARSTFDLNVRACPACSSDLLLAEYDHGRARAELPAQWRNHNLGLRRWASLLPLRHPEAMVSLGEGDSPLLPMVNLFRRRRVFIKDERQNPTISFKDRQAALAVSAMREAGIKEAVVASTGNVAIAYAAYCARAGIKLHAFLTSMVPADKMREVALYGAQVIKLATTYDDSKVLAQQFAEQRAMYYDRGLRSIPSLESMKTIAFELAEQLGVLTPGSGPRYAAPDWYIQSVSGGLGPIGVIKGFQELHALGLIDRLPKLACIQVDGCAPMVAAFAAGEAQARPVPDPRTRVSTLATGSPGKAYGLLKTYIDTQGGTMLAVRDEDGFRAMHQLARSEGLSMEPGAAVAFAGLNALIDAGLIGPDEQVVVNCTGHTFAVESDVLGEDWLRDLSGGQPTAELEGVLAALNRLDERVNSIAIIDDTPDAVRLLKRVLQQAGDYRILEADNGRDGLSLIRAYRPDLIILDLMMPELDGFAVLDALRADESLRATPVIVVTAKALTQSERARLAQQAGAVWMKGDLISDELIEDVQKALR